jgi:hypothetical protein
MGLLSNPEAIASSAGASCLRKEAVAAAAAGAASTTWKEEGGRFAHLYLTRERITIATTAICIPHRTRALLYRPFSFVRTPYFVAEETGDGRGIICNQFPNRRRSRRISTRLFLPRSFAEDSNAALSANVPEAMGVTDPAIEIRFKKWDDWTARSADSATFAFLLLQLPQIYLNFRNLTDGNTSALSAVPWMGQLTSLLGNLALLSYFAGKQERGAMVVQAVGVISTLVVLSQLAIAEAMPLPAFLATASTATVSLLLNYLSLKNKISARIWQLWGEAVTVGAAAVLPQVLWSTFNTYFTPSILPGCFGGAVALIMVVLARLDKLSALGVKILKAMSAWTATLLFMWGPVAQMWTNYLNPSNIKGLSVYTVLLAMIGNGLLLPRALFTRDLMWFVGSSWGTLMQGLGILISMYIYDCIDQNLFYGITATVILWIGSMFVRDAKACSLAGPLQSFSELISGRVPE